MEIGKSLHTKKAGPQDQKRHPACNRCHRRRVKCDASVNGLPCSACKVARRNDCGFLDSRRKRGPAGKFISSTEGSGVPNRPAPFLPEKSKARDSLDLISDGGLLRTAQDPGISVNLAQLCGVDSDHGESSVMAGQINQSVMMGRGHGGRGQLARSRQSTASFLGESWYAAYILSNTNPGHVGLHQPVSQYLKNTSIQCRDDSCFSAETEKAMPSHNLPSDLPSPELVDRLLGAYSSRFHSFCPILEMSSFLLSVRDGTVSHTLLRCVLFISLIHCDPEIFYLMGYSSRLDAGDEYFGKAKAAFDSDNRSDRITMLLSSYLLHYWFGQPTTFRDFLWWLATTIRSAQCMGMHRSTSNSKMQETVRRRWRLIWWCLYIRDRQVSLSAGAPMIINDLDCDVEPLTLMDFEDESIETARYVMSQVELNQVASQLFFAHCSASRLPLSSALGTRLNARHCIQTTLEEWHSNLPDMMRYDRGSGNHLSMTLHMIYHFYTINLHQRLQRQCPKRHIESEGSDIILQSASEITRLLEDMLMNWSVEFFPMICVSAVFASMTAQYAESYSSDTSKSQLLSQKLRISLLGLKQFEQCYILARWIRKLFIDIFENSNHQSDHWYRGKSQVTHKTIHTEQAGPTPPEPTPLELSNLSNFESLSRSSTRTFAPSMASDGDTSTLGSLVGYENSVFQMPNEFLSNLDFPTLSSLEYQGLHFMADLGFAGFTNIHDTVEDHYS